MINNKDDLESIRTHTHVESGKTTINGYFKLANDITFEASDFEANGAYYNDGQGWIPLDGVGWKSNSTAFAGELDGGGHTISGIRSDANGISPPSVDGDGTGLFSYIKGGTVKNLKLKDFQIYKKENSTRKIGGALSGYVQDATIENVSVTDSEIYGERCGGIAGYGISTSFKNCNVQKVKISGNYSCGGIIGAVRSGIIVDGCNIQVEISSTDRKGEYHFFGGVWGGHGFGDFRRELNQIKNTTVDFKYTAEYKGENQGYVGGLIGGVHGNVDEIHNIFTVNVENTVVKVDITSGEGPMVGGLFGELKKNPDGIVKDYSNNVIEAPASSFTNVVVTGTISADESVTPAAIGNLYKCKNASVVLENIYSGLTRKESGQNFPIIICPENTTATLKNCVFVGGETDPQGTLQPDSSYQKVTNPIVCQYGDKINNWHQQVGTPTAGLTFSTHGDVILWGENNSIVANKAGETTISVKTAIMGKEFEASIPVTVSRVSVNVTMSDKINDKAETYDGTPKTIAVNEQDLPAGLNLKYSYKLSGTDDSTYTANPPTNAGTYTVKVESGNPNCTLTGTTTATLMINQANLSSADVTPEKGELPYTGAAIIPDVTVVLNGKTLVKDRDYTVTCSDNISRGTATITVTGMGNYTGTANGSFTITLATLTIAAEDKFSCVGKDLPAFTYKVSGLAEGDHLTQEPSVTCANADKDKKGSYTITADGAVAGDNYTIEYQPGTLTVQDHEWESEFTVDKAPTANQPGSKSIHCKNCNEKKDDMGIPAIENQPVKVTLNVASSGRTLLADGVTESQKASLTSAVNGRFQYQFNGKTLCMLDIVLIDVSTGKPIHDEAVTFTIGYPAGIDAGNYAQYDFVVLHQTADGTMELPAVEATKDGLKITSRLSPFVVGYSLKPAVPDLPKTGDNSPLLLMGMLCLFSVAGMAVLLLTRKKQGSQ